MTLVLLWDSPLVEMGVRLNTLWCLTSPLLSCKAKNMHSVEIHVPTVILVPHFPFCVSWLRSYWVHKSYVVIHFEIYIVRDYKDWIKGRQNYIKSISYGTNISHYQNEAIKNGAKLKHDRNVIVKHSAHRWVKGGGGPPGAQKLDICHDWRGERFGNQNEESTLPQKGLLNLILNG